MRQDTYHLLILDDKTVYAARLAALCLQAWPGRWTITHGQDLGTISEAELQTIDVCLFTHTQTESLHRRTWAQETRFFLLCDETHGHRVSRYLPLPLLIAHIAADFDLSPGHGLTAAAERGIFHLVLAFDRKRRDAFIEAEMAHHLENGDTVYYLPLLPTYLIANDITVAEGDTLADLLLALTTDEDFDDNRLGHVFVRHPDGYLMPRLPERADDLITAELTTLQKLMRLMRQRIDRMGQDHVAILCVDGLPLETVATLAMYVDRITIDTPVNEDRFNQEWAVVAQDLPSSCARTAMTARPEA